MNEEQAKEHRKSGQNYIYIQKEFFNTIYQEDNLDNIFDSWAGDAYRQVFSSIIQTMSLQHKSYSSIPEKYEAEEQFATRNEWDNNIIAITGGRGSGKSSTLNNVVNYLRDYDVDKELITKISPEKGNFELPKTKVTCLGILDPTFFNDSDIMEVVISWLFKMFKSKLEKNGELDVKTKREILREFEDIYKYLRKIRTDNGKRMDGDYIETLDILSSTTKLKYLLNKLIDQTLRFMNDTKVSKPLNKLLIALDDFDQEYANAYKTLEFIRKYLMIPNVIVLIGINMEDLSSFITHSMYKELTLSGEHDDSDYYRAETMSQNYQQKVVPKTHRVELPTMKTVAGETLLFIEGSDNVDFTHYSLDADQDLYSMQLFLRRISRLIYERVGVVLLHDSEHIKLFQYMSIRDINEFIEMLMGLDSENDKNNGNYALKVLEYLVRWFQKSVNTKQASSTLYYIKGLLESEGFRRNKLWVGLFYRWLKKAQQYDQTSELSETEFDKLLQGIDKNLIESKKLLNNPYNVTYADVNIYKQQLCLRETDPNQSKTLLFCEIILSFLCYADVSKRKYKEWELPFYHGLITHSDLARNQRDTIFIYRHKAMKKMITDIVNCLMSANDNKAVSVIRDGIKNADSLFDKFIYYRYPFGKEPPTLISKQSDSKAFYDNETNESSQRVCFSIQAYLLRQWGSGKSNWFFPLNHRELIDAIIIEAKEERKEKVDSQAEYLFEVFTNICNASYSKYQENLTLGITANNGEYVTSILQDEFTQLLFQYGIISLERTNSSKLIRREYKKLSQYRGSLEAGIKLFESISHETNKQTDIVTMVNELTEQFSRELVDQDVGCAKLIWFLSFYMYIESDKNKPSDAVQTPKKSNTPKSPRLSALEVTSENPKTLSELQEYVRNLCDKIPENNNNEGLHTRNVSTIYIELRELHNIVKGMISSEISTETKEKTISKIEFLRSQISPKKKEVNSNDFVGENLDWYIEGLSDIRSLVEDFARGRS